MGWCCFQLTAGFSMSWVSQNLSRSQVNCPAWPSHPASGQLLLGTRACWGIFQCSAGVPGQCSGEEVSGHPWSLLEIPFFSAICFWACSPSRRAATSFMLFEDKECTYSDLYHMLLSFSPPNLTSGSSLRKNIFLFCQVLSLTFLFWGVFTGLVIILAHQVKNMSLSREKYLIIFLVLMLSKNPVEIVLCHP